MTWPPARYAWSTANRLCNGRRSSSTHEQVDSIRSWSPSFNCTPHSYQARTHARMLLSCKHQVLAKEIVQSRRAVNRLYVNKAQMISIANSLTEQLGERHLMCRPTRATKPPYTSGGTHVR